MCAPCQVFKINYQRKESNNYSPLLGAISIKDMSEVAEAPRQRSACLGLFKSQSEPAKLLEPKPEGSSGFGMGNVEN